MPLKIAKLSKRSGNKWVLKDVEFTAPEGRVFGICGGTASGKTMLLNAIAGVGRPNGGTIMLDSQDLAQVKAKDRGISWLTTGETRGLFSFFGRVTQNRSSGEVQKYTFFKALENAGRVLLLDDPFGHMDVNLRAECFEAVRRAARSRDRIVVFATSDFDQIAAIADEMAILHGGTIIQAGTPQEIYEEPGSVAAATISGETNLVEARRLTSTNADLPEFHTINGGHRIFAQRTEKSRLGAINQNIALNIRPEQVSMSMGASFPEDNLLRGVVTGIKFRGPTCLIEFDAAGLKLETRVFRIVGLNIGDECMLGLPPHRIQILRD